MLLKMVVWDDTTKKMMTLPASTLAAMQATDREFAPPPPGCPRPPPTPPPPPEWLPAPAAPPAPPAPPAPIVAPWRSGQQKRESPLPPWRQGQQKAQRLQRPPAPPAWAPLGRTPASTSRSSASSACRRLPQDDDGEDSWGSWGVSSSGADGRSSADWQGAASADADKGGWSSADWQGTASADADVGGWSSADWQATASADAAVESWSSADWQEPTSANAAVESWPSADGKGTASADAAVGSLSSADGQGAATASEVLEPPLEPGRIPLEPGRIPVIGEDLWWHGPPQLLATPVSDGALLKNRDYLWLQGLVSNQVGTWDCLYCEMPVADPGPHLDGYHKESKRHFKNCLFVLAAQQEIATTGWSLKSHDMAIALGCFGCQKCNMIGPWYSSFEHIASKRHRQNVTVEEPTAEASDEQKQAWRDLFPIMDVPADVPTDVRDLPVSARAHQLQALDGFPPALGGPRPPEGMAEDDPSPEQLLAAGRRGEERGYPVPPQPLCWGRDFGKRGMGIWCTSCTSFVGWCKAGSNGTEVDSDGCCAHYNAAVRTVLVQDSQALWGLTVQ